MPAVLSKYPSIDQFRNVIRNVKDHTYYNGKDENSETLYDYTKPLPAIDFIGKIKIHGTNASVVFNVHDFEWWCQSRERIISPLSDNAGFATYVHHNKLEYNLLFTHCFDVLNVSRDLADYASVAIYGEWCGNGVQKGVAISQLPKMFVVFGIKLIHKDPEGVNVWVDDETMNNIIKSNPDINLYNINDFKQFKITIDFKQPEIAQHQIVQWVDEVEQQCPVGTHFGVSGIGEGIVFSAHCGDDVYRFKAKGVAHSNSKVKTVAAVDIEKVNSINELCETILTENRLQQGLTWMTENNHDIDVKNTGTYIKWVVNDCLKEELDTIVGSSLEVKEVSPKLSAKAKQWFFETLNNNEGI
jgi:hypothetical protein